MYRILFVCHGNICRSPMAEFIFRDLAEKSGAGDRFFVSSCATSSEEIWNGIGNPVDPRAAAQLRKLGIDPSGKRAVRLKKSDYDAYDRLIAMDSENEFDMRRLFGGDPEGKITFLPGVGEVDDPWYTGRFEAVCRQILEGCSALLDELLEEGK